MESAPKHRTAEDFAEGLSDVLASPTESGSLQEIFIRPSEDKRRQVATAELTVEGGITGDRWADDHWQKLPDGSSDPISQVSVMNARILKLIAGEERAMGLAGDNLIVDLDLSEKNFPAGSQLQIGESVVIEFTSQPHTGCRKFALRYGQAAKEFINGSVGKPLNLRGRYARILSSGTIQQGDLVKKV